MENKIKHLEMVQAIINRMANNSFLLKGWSVLLVSALFALSVKDANKLYVYVAYFPAIAFWILDGYFLWQERLYRKLYDKIRGLEESEIDFSMDITSVVSKVDTWSEVIISKTLSIFHGVIVGVIIMVMLIEIYSFN